MHKVFFFCIGSLNKTDVYITRIFLFCLLTTALKKVTINGIGESQGYIFKKTVGEIYNVGGTPVIVRKISDCLFNRERSFFIVQAYELFSFTTPESINRLFGIAHKC